MKGTLALLLSATLGAATAAQTPESVALDNAYVHVTRNGAPCAAGAGSSCGDRVIVALAETKVRTRGTVRTLARGDVAVLRRGRGTATASVSSCN